MRIGIMTPRTTWVNLLTIVRNLSFRAGVKTAALQQLKVGHSGNCMFDAKSCLVGSHPDSGRARVITRVQVPIWLEVGAS